MLINVNEYSNSLKKLWAETFGDDREYINLLFDCEYTPAECFAEISDGEVISVLYLLKGYIMNGDESFEGRYLYAAATDVEHRGKGIMAKLINEAQKYAKDKKLSFICLVPADEGLYGYYARFGFKAVMKNYVSELCGVISTADDASVSLTEYPCLRRNLPVPYFNFGEREWKYAVSCLSYAGYSLIKNSEDSYFITDEDKSEVIEYISSYDNLRKNTEALLGKLSSPATVVSAYDLGEFGLCEEKCFGMVYFTDENLRTKIQDDIYMNIALD